MEAMVAEFLERIEFGPMQEHENMAVLPLLADVAAGPDYRTMSGAMSEGLLSVVEVNAEGSVPELKVTNVADVSVLLLDGEELMGAKQNRVLNTSILLGVKSETIIPVSCTEHGRWSYSSPVFSDSEVVMSPSLRMRKVRSVSASLEESGRYSSDQQEVWDRVARLSEAAGAHSSTGAMRDTYRSRGSDLEAFLPAFKAVPRQKGLLAMIGGTAVGFDVVSREDAYVGLHDKLVRSYAMDALVSAEKKGRKGSAEVARTFVRNAAACEGTKHQSVGLGWDRRFQGTEMVGSALICEDAVIHAAFFRADDSEEAGRMSSPATRRRYRA